MEPRRQFSTEFKRKVVEEVKSRVLTRAQAARQYQIRDSLLHRWMDLYDHGKLDNPATETGALENRIAQLERKIGQLTMENDLLKKARELSVRREREKLSGPFTPGVSQKNAKS
jgi:transposase-like protein